MRTGVTLRIVDDLLRIEAIDTSGQSARRVPSNEARRFDLPAQDRHQLTSVGLLLLPKHFLT